MEDIVTLINTCGFPIAVCIGCFYYLNTTHKSLSEAINRNTVVVEKLITKLDKDVEK